MKRKCCAVKTIFNDGVLAIELTGRIDSTNSISIRKKIFASIAKNHAESIIFDAKDLKYISNIGQSVILKVKKAKPDTHIVNVSSEVYEILDSAGFTDIVDTRKVIREISVDGCEIIGENNYGIIYRSDENAVIKVYKKHGLNDIEREMELVRQAFIKGIPTAVSSDIVKCGERYGAVFEIAGYEILSDRMKKDTARFDEYVEKFTALVKKLHSIELDDNRLVHVNDAYRCRFAELKDLLTAEEMSELNRFIDSIPERNTVIHSGLHAGSIMIRSDEQLLIDTDALMCGHPIYDMCEVYTYLSFSEEAGKNSCFSDEMCIRFINKFTALYFTGSIREDRDKAVSALKVFGEYRKAYIYLAADDGISFEERRKSAADIIKKNVLPDIDAVIDALEMDFVEW